MTLKLLLIGGVGNQLFVLARALSSNAPRIRIYRFSKSHEKILGYFGWSKQKDWLGTEKIANSIDLRVETLPLPSFVYLMITVALRKITNRAIIETPNSKTKGWDLGYFHSEISTTKKAIEEVVLAIKKHLADKLATEASGCCVVHYRQGDMPEKYSLSQLQVSNFITKNCNTKISIICPNQIICEARNITVHSENDEIDDLNLLRNADKVLMGSSTFAFWSLMTSDQVKNQEVYLKSGYYLAKQLKRFGFKVIEI